MPYLGNTPTTQNFISGTDYFNGTGAQTAFTLTRTVNSVNDIQVVVNNVVQQPNDAYTLSGTTLTFTSAPSSGTNNVYVRYLSTTLQSITPSYGSIIPSMLNPPNTIYWNTSGNVGIGTTNPGYKLDVTGATSTYIGVASTNASTGSGLFTTNATRTYLIGAGAASGNSNLEFRDVTGAATRMVIDTNGNVGIGTTSPAQKFVVSEGGTNFVTSVGGGVQFVGTTTNNSMALITNSIERMRIASNGVVSIGTTNQSAQLTVDATTTGIYSSVTGAFVAGYFLTGGANYAVYAQSSANYGIYGRTTDASYGGCIGVAGNGSTYGIIGYANAWGLYTNANIYVNGTTYTSDARLKENVQPISNALNTITQLNPVSFDWKANSSKGITNNNQPLPDYGMIAQEVEQVLPDIVYEVPVPPKPLENNEPDSLEQELGSCKGVDYSRLIPFLTKAIQEQQAMIEELKARIETLEAK